MGHDSRNPSIADKQVRPPPHHHERNPFIETELNEICESLLCLGLRPILGRTADPHRGVLGKRFMEPDAAGPHHLEKGFANGQIPRQICAGLVDVSGAKTQNQIAVLQDNRRHLITQATLFDYAHDRDDVRKKLAPSPS